MRFIVDLYRYIIVGFCGVAIIALAFAFFTLIDQSGPAGSYPAWSIAATLGAAVLMILSIGGLAIIVSLHDRHAELTEAAGEIIEAIDRLTETLARREDQA